MFCCCRLPGLLEPPLNSIPAIKWWPRMSWPGVWWLFRWVDAIVSYFLHLLLQEHCSIHTLCCISCPVLHWWSCSNLEAITYGIKTIICVFCEDLGRKLEDDSERWSYNLGYNFGWSQMSKTTMRTKVREAPIFKKKNGKKKVTMSPLGEGESPPVPF